MYQEADEGGQGEPRATYLIAPDSFECPGCKRTRQKGWVYVLGPDPIIPRYGPLLWDPYCLDEFNKAARGLSE